MPDATYLADAPVTPEYVLSVLRDEHRQAVRIDYCCDASIDLTFDSTIDDWRNAVDLLETRPLGRAMNQSWNIQVSDQQWRAVLHPPRRKTLRGVTELIARHAVRHQLRPLAIAGTHCLPAAAFLAIKDSLAADGADVSGLAPSTPLAEYARCHVRALLGPISRLAPGALPGVDISPRENIANLSLGCASAVFYLVGIIAAFLESPFAFLILIGSILQLIHWIDTRRKAPRLSEAVAFGELQTFRDLSKCIAAGISTR